jgi:hypothetical protein
MRRRRTRSKPGFAAPVAAQQVVRVWACDEGRVGLRVGLRGRWCPRGVRPPWVVHDRDEWLWRYAAVEPATGEAVFLLLPRVTKEWFARTQPTLPTCGQGSNRVRADKLVVTLPGRRSAYWRL